MSDKLGVLPYEFLESIPNDEFENLTLHETDTSDTSSNIDDQDYLSDEERSNKYTFLQKTSKKKNNQYKEQFKTIQKKSGEQLGEEAYISD